MRATKQAFVLSSRAMIFAVLRNRGAWSGSEIMDACRLRTSGRLSPNEGSLYPQLARMLREGLVRRLPPVARQGKPKVPFVLTAKGRAAAERVVSQISGLFNLTEAYR